MSFKIGDTVEVRPDPHDFDCDWWPKDKKVEGRVTRVFEGKNTGIWVELDLKLNKKPIHACFNPDELIRIKRRRKA